jgi:[acyl-carrier-protein] S-malonyltransferase
MSHSIAFLFPGQGRAPEGLPPGSERGDGLFAAAEERGLSLRTLIAEGRADVLGRTQYSQPALFIDSLAREEALRAAEWIPDVVAGHSLGEYSALVSSGALDPLDGLAVVIERGRVMSGVSGTMAAILKLEIDAVQALCDEVGDGVCIANHNGPTQVVVSGNPASVEQLSRQAERAGGRSIALRVSGPFHSPLMIPAQEALEPFLRRLRLAAPRIPVVSSVTATVHRDPERLLEILCQQMTARVRWLDAIRRLEELGVAVAVEAGSGDVLTRLGRRTPTGIRFITYEEAIDERA